jgi:hypothetical protein
MEVRFRSLLPFNENKHQRQALRSTDIMRSPYRFLAISSTAPCEVGYRVKQVWLKNDQDLTCIKLERTILLVHYIDMLLRTVFQEQ